MVPVGRYLLWWGGGTIVGTTVNDNHASGGSEAIDVESPATLILQNSTVSETV
jgi:hypothetical protein